MARRESQGLQIALISFVILTIVLLLTTYYFFSRSQSLADEAEDATNQANQNRSALTTAEDDLGKLRQFMGVDGGVAISAVESNYNEDMAFYGQGMAEPASNYRLLLEYMQQIIGKKNEQIANSTAEVKRLLAEVKQVQNKEQQRADKFEQAQEDTTAVLNGVRTKSAKDVQDATTTSDDLLQKMQQQEATLTAQLQEKQSTIDELTGQINDLRLAMELRDRKIAGLQQESLDQPDGKVLSANPGKSRVLINIGREQGLRPQIRFTVFEADVNNLATAKKKGVIEVTRIADRNLAYAKIIDGESDITNPIIEGDVLFSPLWDRGGKLRFALVGKMDVNDDGLDDRDEIRDMIRLSGGLVDAEDADGSVKGRITTDTRYLVLGSRRKETTTESATDTYTKMIDDAVRMGVEQISVRKLANYVGFRGRRRAIPMGPDARGEDFRPTSSSRNYIRY